ncbi:hypothetical protein T4A_691 [Trichinella pseudospiralis]|uniref:Uncharacterized protein n=1 Tax=Trichinella pseudospiralis TaxID=6337 RepID=A0A0V1EHE5_TRIPS|nr:hypothetical protein T4A_691 [Trichinella pseudospiralis]
MSFGWFQQNQSANRSAQDTCRDLASTLPGEEIHDLTKGTTSSWSQQLVPRHRLEVAPATFSTYLGSLGLPRTLVSNASKKHQRASAGRTNGGASVADYCSTFHAKHDCSGLEMPLNFGQ